MLGRLTHAKVIGPLAACQKILVMVESEQFLALYVYLPSIQYTCKIFVHIVPFYDGNETAERYDDDTGNVLVFVPVIHFGLKY